MGNLDQSTKIVDSVGLNWKLFLKWWKKKNNKNCDLRIWGNLGLGLGHQQGMYVGLLGMMMMMVMVMWAQR